MKFLAAVVLMFAAAIAQASTITIDFEHPYTVGSDYKVYTQGFIFSGFSTYSSSPMNASYAAVITGQNGTNVFGPPPSQLAGIQFTREDGAAFAFYGMDLYGSSYPDPLEINGTTAGGQTIYASSTPLSSSDWLNVTRVGVGAGYYPPEEFFNFVTLQIDNVVVGAAVPIPAAVWLFGSALGLLGWARRAQ